MSNIPLAAGHTIACHCICLLCLVLFDSGNIAPASFTINNINKGRWTEEEHKIFMQEYEKYGNDCIKIAKVLSTQTPGQIKKTCCMFLQTKFENKFCSSETISRLLVSQWKSTGLGQTCRSTTKTSTISFTWGQSPNANQKSWYRKTKTMQVLSSSRQPRWLDIECKNN